MICDSIVIEISIIHLSFNSSLWRTLPLVKIFCLTLTYSLPFLPKQLWSISPFAFLHTLSILLTIYFPNMLSLQSSILSHQSIDNTFVIRIFTSTFLSTWFSFHLTLNLPSILTFDTCSTKVIFKFTILRWTIML